MTKVVAFLVLFAAIGINSQSTFNQQHARNRELHLRNPPGRLTREAINFFGKIMDDDAEFARILQGILKVRVPGTPAIAEVRRFIIDEMTSLGWDVTVDQFTDRTPKPATKGTTEFVNIISTLNPSAPRRLILACHYDSKLSPKGFMGATDSAVPCTQMIHLATVMKKQLERYNQTSNELTLQFVFFDGEEPFVEWRGNDNTYGSRHLAAKWESSGLNQGIDVLVLLDLLGAENPKITSLDNKTHQWHKKLAELEQLVVADDRAMPKSTIFSRSGPRNTGISDDHIPFLIKGVRILHLIAAPFPSVWHNLGDNATAIHQPTVTKLNRIFRMFVAQYLKL